MIRYPFDIEKLPSNGIYFFYEERETWGHGADQPRIVRIGTSRQGNLRSRISEHFLFDERKMVFDLNRPKPSDRSIFRKNIGRTLLNQSGDPYLEIWDMDFTPRKNRERFRHLRDINKEREIETQITGLLRSSFYFRFVIMDDAETRKELERCLIATVANCSLCQPSPGWLGRHSPKNGIKESGLWQVHHLKHQQIGKQEMKTVRTAMMNTRG